MAFSKNFFDLLRPFFSWIGYSIVSVFTATIIGWIIRKFVVDPVDKMLSRKNQEEKASEAAPTPVNDVEAQRAADKNRTLKAEEHLAKVASVTTPAAPAVVPVVAPTPVVADAPVGVPSEALPSNNRHVRFSQELQANASIPSRSSDIDLTK